MTFKTLILVVVAGAAIWGYGADGSCIDFPTDLQSGNWHSSDFGTVTANGTHIFSSSLIDFGAVEFECISYQSNILYMLSSNFTYLGANLRVGACWRLHKASDTKYHYYPMTPVLTGASAHRVIFQASSYTFTWAETCSLWNSDISYSQTRLLIKDGYQNVSREECPYYLLGNFNYQVNSSTCLSNVTSLDVCTTKNQMITNYTTCSDKIFFSEGGVVSCVYSVVFGTMTYTILYNEDTSPDESTYYRYTCLITTNVYNTRYVTYYPRACLENQTHLVVDSPGTWGTFYAESTCVTDSDDDASVIQAGAVAAIVLALLILGGAGAVIGIWYYIKVYRVKKISPDGVVSATPPLDTKEQQKLDGRVSPFSPYPTVSELAVYRFGSSPPPDIDDDDGGMTLEATTPGFTEGRRTIYDKDADRESQTSLPVYSEVGGETPDPTRLSEVQTRMSEVSEANIADPTPWTMTRATMNIPEETSVSPIQSPTENKPEHGDINDATL